MILRNVFAYLLIALPICLMATVNEVPAQDEKQEEKQEETTGESTGEEDQDSANSESTDEGDDEATQEESVADDSFEGLMNQWAEINKKLDAQKIAFDEADDTNRDDAKQKYVDLVNEANALVDKIEAKAIEELPQASDEEKKTTLLKTLLGIMINDATVNNDDEILKIMNVLVANQVDPELLDKAANANRLPQSMRAYFEEVKTLLAQKDEKLPRVKIATTKGDIVVELFEKEAPGAVGNFISLVEKDFYKDLKFHRVLEGFMAQGGCPKGDGTGDPGYSIFSEFDSEDARPHLMGSISWANSGKDTAGSQFFLCFNRKATASLDGKHTVFGRIVEGLDVLPKIQRVDPRMPGQADPDKIVSMEVLSKTEGKEYKPNIVPGSETTTDGDGNDKDKEGDESKKDDSKK